MQGMVVVTLITHGSSLVAVEIGMLVVVFVADRVVLIGVVVPVVRQF